MSVRFLSFLLLGLVVLGVAPRAEALRIIDADEVLANHTVERDGTLFFRMDGHDYELITDPASPYVSQMGDGQFHTMPYAEVDAAARSVASLTSRLNVRIFILPYPRRAILKSSAHDQTIVLTAGIREFPREHVWATVVHEIGHAVQRARIPQGGELWKEYENLRGLDVNVHHNGAVHRNRPREIFAEDFRVVFGSSWAVSSGSIENPDLPLPGAVPGLISWFERVLTGPTSATLDPDDHRITAAPNPFRASGGGEVAIRFAAGPQVATPLPAIVYDLTGRRVATLNRGERTSEGEMRFSWNGRNDQGDLTSAGVYFVKWLASPASAARVQILR